MKTICILVAIVAVASATYQKQPGHEYHRRKPSRPRPQPRRFDVIDECTCHEKGNFYTPVSSYDCRSFMQRTAFLPAMKQNCPYGLQFDVQTCVCNYPENTFCPRTCPAPYSAPARTERSCQQNGNLYRQVPNTDCAAFTQETATLPPQKHYCPRGLTFDLKTCVCNYPKDTVCYA